MELTEKERLMLVEKKEDILHATIKILEIINNEELAKDPKQTLEVKKQITSIMSWISIIASYAKAKSDLRQLTVMTENMFPLFNLLDELHSAREVVEMFCNVVNNIQFDFTQKSIRIKIPKIDLSLFNFKS